MTSVRASAVPRPDQYSEDHRQALVQMHQEALEGLEKIPGMLQTVGRCLEAMKRCKRGSKRYQELDSVVIRYNNEVSELSSLIRMALLRGEPKEEGEKCRFCGGRIVSGDDVHPGYTGWPCCEGCHAC